MIHTVPERPEADIAFWSQGGMALLQPLNEHAAAWLIDKADTDAMWLGETLTLDSRYLAPWRQMGLDDGVRFEER